MRTRHIGNTAIVWHTARRDDYDGWHQVLCAETAKRLELDIADWLFFFGRV